MKNKLPFIGLFFVIIIYGFCNILYRFIGSTNYLSVAFFILVFSSLLTIVILLASKKLHELKSLKKIKLTFALGVINVSVWLLIYFSIMNSSIANAVLGFITAPIFVAMLSPLILKENINKHILIALVIAVMGILLIFDPRNLTQSFISIGVISGIFVGFFSGMNSIIGRKLKDLYSPASLAFLGSFIGMLIMFPIYLLSNPIIPNTISMIIILTISTVGITGGILVYYSLKFIIAQSVQIILLLEPLISIIAAFVVFLEVPSLLTIVGGILLLFADLIIIRNQR